MERTVFFRVAFDLFPFRILRRGLQGLPLPALVERNPGLSVSFDLIMGNLLLQRFFNLQRWIFRGFSKFVHFSISILILFLLNLPLLILKRIDVLLGFAFEVNIGEVNPLQSVDFFKIALPLGIPNVKLKRSNFNAPKPT